MVSSTIIAVTFTVCLFAAHHVYTFPGSKRILTDEEEALANDARNRIANVLERNLIKFFTLVAADNGRGPFARQQDDDEETTLNPHTLPQVAQILGAIFAGNFNLTSVVDRAFNLVPDVLKNQVTGLFNLLTNQKDTTTTTLKPRRRARITTKKVSATSAAAEVTTTTTTEQEPITSTFKSLIKNRYRIRPKNETASLSPNAIFSSSNEEDDDDELLLPLEDELINAAIDAEPYVRNKEPRFFLGSMNGILSNLDNGRLNLTQIIRFLPDLFQGTRQMFTLLESLGQLGGELGDVDY